MALPGGFAPNPHDRLQMAVFTAHLAEDAMERQRERFADSPLWSLAPVSADAAKTLTAWRAAIVAGPRESMYDAIRADPLWRMSSPPDDLRRVPADAE